MVSDVGPQESFRALRTALHVTSAFREHAPVRQAVAFHMTIAEFISAERTVELLDELGRQLARALRTQSAVKASMKAAVSMMGR